MNKILLAAALITSTAIQALAWGQKGHDITASIAQQHLTPATQAAVDSLLDGRSMVYWANWLDNASNTPEYAYSKTWHYKNIDAGVDYDMTPLNTQGDVVTALQKQYTILTDPKADKNAKNLALKIMIHLAGDAHQPMHVGHATDRGGNGWPVKFFRDNTNLHSLWDGALVEAAHKWSYTEWTDQLERIIAHGDNPVNLDGTFNDWVRETWIVTTPVYDTTPRDASLSYNYISYWTPVIEQQFMRGGLRLAHTLNTIFDPTYQK